MRALEWPIFTSAGVGVVDAIYARSALHGGKPRGGERWYLPGTATCWLTASPKKEFTTNLALLAASPRGGERTPVRSGTASDAEL